jgi:hypothetical protein
LIINDKYDSDIHIKEDDLRRQVVLLCVQRYAFRVLVGKTEGRRSFESCSGVWEDNSRLTGIGWEGLDWIHLAQGRDNWRTFVNAIIFDSMQCREFVDSLVAC